MSKTLISTIYEGNATNAAIIKFSPDKVVIITSKPKDEKKSTSRKSIKDLKDKYKTIKIEIVDTSVYEIPKIVYDVCKVTDRENKLGNDRINIFFHLNFERENEVDETFSPPIASIDIPFLSDKIRILR